VGPALLVGTVMLPSSDAVDEICEVDRSLKELETSLLDNVGLTIPEEVLIIELLCEVGRPLDEVTVGVGFTKGLELLISEVCEVGKTVVDVRSL